MKYVLITGGNRGLGLGFVNHFSKLGYTVFAGYRGSIEEFDNSNIIPIKLDVTNDESINAAREEIAKYTDHLDVLVNNAGVSRGTIVKNNPGVVSNLDSLDRDMLLLMFNINTISPLLVVKAFREMIEESDSSFVINISSARASFLDEYGYDTPNYGYRGSKAGLNIITKDLTTELKKHVRVFSVDPGDVNTDMNSNGVQNPQETASQIMDIANNWKDSYNGEFMRFSGEPYPR